MDRASLVVVSFLVPFCGERNPKAMASIASLLSRSHLSVSCPEVLIEGCPLGILLSIDSGNRSVDQGLQLSLGACPCMVASTLVRFSVTFTDVDVDVREIVYGA